MISYLLTFTLTVRTLQNLINFDVKYLCQNRDVMDTSAKFKVSHLILELRTLAGKKKGWNVMHDVNITCITPI